MNTYMLNAVTCRMSDGLNAAGRSRSSGNARFAVHAYHDGAYAVARREERERQRAAQQCCHGRDHVVERKALARGGGGAEDGHWKTSRDPDADHQQHESRLGDLRELEPREPRQRPDRQSRDSCAGDEPDAGVHDHERAQQPVDERRVAARISGGDVAHEAVSVAEIEQLKVCRHRCDEHPEAVLVRAEMPDGERHQEDAQAHVHRKEQVSRGGAGDEGPADVHVERPHHAFRT